MFINLHLYIKQEDAGLYTQLVRDMIEKGENRLVVNINDLRKKNLPRTTGYCKLLLFVDINIVSFGAPATTGAIGTAFSIFMNKTEF